MGKDRDRPGNERQASLFNHQGVRVRASAAKSAVANLRDQTSLAGVGVNCDAAKPDSDIGRALTALGLLGSLNIEYVTSCVMVNEQTDLEAQLKKIDHTLSPGTPVSPRSGIQDTSLADGCMQLGSAPTSMTSEIPGCADPKPEPCHHMESCDLETVAREQLDSVRETYKVEDALHSNATWQPDDTTAGVIAPDSHHIGSSGLAWLGRTSTASLCSRQLLQTSPSLNSPRQRATVKDPASVNAPLAAMYSAGAARSMRLGEFRRPRPWSLRNALVSLNSSMHSSHPFSAREQREPQTSAEIEVFDVPGQQEFLPDLAALEQPVTALPQPIVGGASSFPRRAANPEDASAMVALKCGHRLPLSRLSAAEKAAELVSGAGFAAQGTLICPFCGEQAYASHDGLKAYSSSADEYVGELRKDYQVPLRVPQPPPRVAVKQQLGGALTVGESASSSAATSASGMAWTAEPLRSRSSLDRMRGGLRSSGAGPRTAPAATTAPGSRQRPLLASKPARSAAASVLSSPKPPSTAPAKLRSALGSL